MKTRLLNYWENLRSSYWFLPALLTGLAIFLAVVTIAVDQSVFAQESALLRRLYAGGPESVRTLLSTLAGSTITMASVTFSITIVALTLASSQFGPRLLNNFMRDTGNQVVLGTFIATFVYSVLILRTVRAVGGDAFVPRLSVAVALLLVVFSLALFIYFIHHVSVSIQVGNVIADVEKDLNAAIERLFPEKKSPFFFEYALRNEADLPDDFDEQSRGVPAGRSGYLQTIDNDGLMELAIEENLLLRIAYRPGDFIAGGNDLVQIYRYGEGEDHLHDETVNEAFILGAQRLRLQDVEYAIDQLVEIAVRALSPGVNDPFTAMACIDRLSVALATLAGRQIPSGYRYDQSETLRLIADTVTFQGLVDSAFNQIRQHARGDVAVSIRLLEAIAVIAVNTRSAADRASLLRQARMILRGGEEALPEKNDRDDLQERYELLQRIIEEPDSG